MGFWKNLVQGRWPQYVGSPNPNLAYQVPDGAGEVAARQPYGYWPTYPEAGQTQQGYVSDWMPRTVWPAEMTPGGVASFRTPYMLTPNISMLAGLKSVDGAHQNASYLFLPPIAPEQRGGSVQAVAGGRNRASINSRATTLMHIPAVYVPIGRGYT